MGKTNKTIGQQKKNKKKKRVLPFLIFVLVIGILAAAVVFGFQTKTITVTGVNYCSKTEVTKMVKKGRFSNNSLYTFLNYKLHRGEVLGCFESVDVSLISPWEVKVKVVEKRPIGYLNIKKKNEKVYFDGEGIVVHISKTIMDEVPLVEGIKPKKVTLYEKIECGSSTFFEELLKTDTLLKGYEIPVKKYLYDDGYIYIYSRRVRINLGIEVTGDKISQIPPILEKIGNREGTLHLENYSKIGDSVPFKEESISKKSE